MDTFYIEILFKNYVSIFACESSLVNIFNSNIWKEEACGSI